MSKTKLSWISERGEDTGRTSAAKIVEANRPIQGIMAYQKRDSKWEIAWGTSAGGEKIELEFMNLWRFSVDKSES